MHGTSEFARFGPQVVQGPQAGLGVPVIPGFAMVSCGSVGSCFNFPYCGSLLVKPHSVERRSNVALTCNAGAWKEQPGSAGLQGSSSTGTTTAQSPAGMHPTEAAAQTGLRSTFRTLGARITFPSPCGGKPLFRASRNMNAALTPPGKLLFPCCLSEPGNRPLCLFTAPETKRRMKLNARGKPGVPLKFGSFL